MKYIHIIYYVFAVFALGYGSVLLFKGAGTLWMNIGIVVIGLYFLYRGIARSVNERIRRERDSYDSGNDPANA